MTTGPYALYAGCRKLSVRISRPGKGEGKKTRKKRHGDSAIAHMLCWAASQHPEYTNPDYATPASTGLIPAAEAASTRFVDPDHSYMPYRSY